MVNFGMAYSFGVSVRQSTAYCHHPKVVVVAETGCGRHTPVMTQDSLPSEPAIIASRIDEIWAGDLFKRRDEAELLVGYVESVGQRAAVPEDHRGFTISVDADYGIGKTYFLRRFAKHLALNHPVAFVDAWTDDLADEPLTAIAATLKKALAPLIISKPTIGARWDIVASKTGQVAKIVGKGLLKKGLGFLITATAVEALENLGSEISEDGLADLRDDITDFGETATEGAVDVLGRQPPKKLMADRIADFEAGQAAIAGLKASLSDLISALPDAGLSAPIVIVIDELDRCRPNYALKLLEEAKHLFDVPGIVFVFGMHAAQLSQSVSGTYGPGFDGQAYLRRFINRQYRLSFPEMEPLVQHLLNANSIPDNRLHFLQTEQGGRLRDATPAMMIAMYMRAYGMSARDVFRIIDVIQTCVAVSPNTHLFMPLLLPMIIGDIKGLSANQLPMVVEEPTWKYRLYDNAGESRDYVNFSLHEVADRAQILALQTRNEVGAKAGEGDNIAYILIDYMNNRGVPGQQQSSANEYGRLLQRLSRFSVSSQS